MSYNEELESRNAALRAILEKILLLPSDAVRYTVAQSLTEAEKVQAQANIGLGEAFVDTVAARALELLGGNPVWGTVDGNNHVIVHGLAEGTYTFGFVMADGSIVDGGELVLDNSVYYSVTNNLTNCVSSNSAAQVAQGSSYSATITANAGYELESVTVTMGGSAVEVSGGTISIAAVTGDIVITAVAKAQTVEADPTNFFKASPTVSTKETASQDALVMGGRLGGDGGYRVDGGPDCLLSNYIPVQSGDVVYIKNADVYSNLSSGLYNSGKTAISVFTQAGSNDVTANNTTSGQQQYTVNHANAAYLRLCLKPAAAITVDSIGADASLRYDLTKVVVNVKRGGAWL